MSLEWVTSLWQSEKICSRLSFRSVCEAHGRWSIVYLYKRQLLAETQQKHCHHRNIISTILEMPFTGKVAPITTQDSFPVFVRFSGHISWGRFLKWMDLSILVPRLVDSSTKRCLPIGREDQESWNRGPPVGASKKKVDPQKLTNSSPKKGLFP